jgi:hypothetical protein
VAPRAAPARGGPPLHVRLERTTCLGTCQSYSLEIDAARRLARWAGRADDGSPQRVVRITDDDVRVLEQEIAASRFFERDERGALPVVPECTSDGTTTTCTLAASVAICGDTPHAIITITRGTRAHTVDYDFCSDNPEMVGLARLIERIGRSPVESP